MERRKKKHLTLAGIILIVFGLAVAVPSFFALISRIPGLEILQRLNPLILQWIHWNGWVILLNGLFIVLREWTGFKDVHQLNIFRIISESTNWLSMILLIWLNLNLGEVLICPLDGVSQVKTPVPVPFISGVIWFLTLATLFDLLKSYYQIYRGNYKD